MLSDEFFVMYKNTFFTEHLLVTAFDWWRNTSIFLTPKINLWSLKWTILKLMTLPIVIVFQEAQLPERKVCIKPRK